MADEREPGYDLVMPFVNVASKGGPYADDAYCAGWAMGALDTRLAELKPVSHTETIRAADREQVDLIAMKNGYGVQFGDSELDEWVFAEFTLLSVGTQ